MNRNGFCIGILPIGEIDPIYLKVIAGSLLGELHIKSIAFPPLAYPEYAYNKRRIQYNAGTMINRLETMEFKECSKVIALVDADLFIPVFSFVLGEARMGGSTAIVSLYRLQNRSERAVKVALHEFGHLMNLEHCHETSCIMKFSKNTEQLDSISTIFCNYCLEHIHYMIRKKE